MKVELTKRDLASLVRSRDPYYSAMGHHLVAKCGTYHGGFKDRWSWHWNFEEDMTEEQLWELYNIVKNSWNENG